MKSIFQSIVRKSSAIDTSAEARVLTAEELTIVGGGLNPQPLPPVQGGPRDPRTWNRA